MNTRHVMTAAFLAVCLVTLAALPVSAAPRGQAGNSSTIDPGLLNDLRASHTQYRLAHYDLNVRHATETIDILDGYSVDTTVLEGMRTTISNKRTDLESALSSGDRAAIKDVNHELLTFWKQFIKEVRDTIREHYGGAAPAEGQLVAEAIDGMSGL